jgi:pyruvate,water dikinase
MQSANAKKDKVFFFEDYSAKDLNENKIGRKGLSLFELKDMDVPVPEFFVVSSDVFVDLAFNSLEDARKKLLAKGRNPEKEEVESVFLKADLPKEVEEQILSAYTRLSGFTDAWVSVRSSVVFPENPQVSFSGVFSTELNVRKFDELKDAVKRVFASMFCDDVVAYASKMGIDLADVKMSVVVQKMVQSEVSGVVFTVDPITQDNTKLSIEAVYGLGDVISLGEITPDTYLLNKKDLTIAEKHIAPQEWMKVRTAKSSKSKASVEKIKISSNWSHKQKLSDKDMKEISKIALIVENKSRQIQNIEWVLSGGKFWVLQNKPLYETTIKEDVVPLSSDLTRRNIRDLIVGFVEKYRGENMIVAQAVSDAQRMMKRNSNEAARKLEKLILSAKKESKEESVGTKQEDFVASGIGASFGVSTGKVTVVDSPTDKKFTKEDILLIKKYSSEMEGMIMASGGVIMDTGGLTSDTAILCREVGVPAVVGTKNASESIKSGDWVKIDGNAGTVYLVEKEKVEPQEKVHPVVKAYSEGNVIGTEDIQKHQEEVQQKEEEKEEQNEGGEEADTPSPPKDTTLPPSATKVFSMVDAKPKELFDYVGNSHGIVYVDLDKILIEDGRHIMAYVDDKKFVDFSNNICEKIMEYVDLAQGDEVVVSIGSRKVADFRDLTKGTQYEEGSLPGEAYGATHYINNLDTLKRVIKIIRRLRNVYKKRNVSVAIHSPMSGENMREFKKQLSGEKLRRTSSFKIYAILDNPSEVILADEIVSTKIDGLILNMPRITRQMQGFSFDDTKAKYDLTKNSVFKVLDNIIEVVRKDADNIIVIVENSKPLLRYCVQTGVYGVSVFSEDVAEARKVVSEEESKVILEK